MGHYCRHINKKYAEEHYGKKRSLVTPYYEDGREIILQYVHIDKNTKEDEQDIGYFIIDENTQEILTKSTTVTVKRNCQLRTILKAIEQAEGLVRKEI